jgi:uncharacterized membrane protein
MSRYVPALVALLVLSPGTARAGVTFEMIGNGFPTGVSADGSAVVGVMPGTYEVFRWTAASGVVPLGMCSGCVLGRVGSMPSISEDGRVIAGSILTADSLYVTPGLWREATGWQQLIPPVPADCGLLDDAYGSGWAVSGDGLVAGGLYWRPGQPGGLAHAFRWSETGGFADLGSSGRDSRVCAADHDGSVLVGWDSDPDDAHWRATAWVDGVMTTLSLSPAFTEAHAVTPDGLTIAGMDYDDVKHKGIAALWKWNGAAWDRTVLGVLPGTFAYYGEAHALDLTADARTVVGFNRYDNVSSAGFLWSAATGMREATQFLAEQGITLPGDFVLTTLTAISEDGRTIAGAGQQVFFPYAQQWFVIRLDSALGVGAGSPAAAGPSAFPNPLRGATSVRFALAERGEAELGVFDVSGRSVRSLLSGEQSPGEHVVRWDGRDERGASVAPGVYYVRLLAGVRSGSTRIVVLN